MNEKELFENNCFPLFWSENDEIAESPTIQPRKDLSVLMAELEEIKNRIDDITEREWHLEKLVKFHKLNLAKQ